MMAISRKKLWPQELGDRVVPIKCLTENGFSIVRTCEVDDSVQNSPGDCRFLVARDNEREREVQVSFGDDLVAALHIRRRIPFAEGTMFWIVCAESCLATYLWEHDRLPPQDHLAIQELSPDELMLALHWRDRN